LFFGEEVTMAVRLFGAGYDLYPPDESVCYHLWSRAHRPALTSLESDQAKELRKISMERVKEQLKSHVGTERSAKEFAEKLGVCFLTRTIHADRKPSLANLDPESKALILKFMSNEFNY
jgi:[Skp1-protein]-hydroxyproline N-acetylglucosaminyltransferase